MTYIVDARSNKSNRSAENRRKFLNRVKGFIKKEIPKIVNKSNVKDLINSDQEIHIPKHSLSEPSFIYETGDKETTVLTGNKEYIRGDIIHKQNSSDEGSGGSETDDGSSDDFIIRLTSEEFLNYFFDDLELPDLIKQNLLLSKEFERKNAGWQLDGSPGRLSVVKSLKTAYLRRLALIGPYKKELNELLNDDDNEEDEDVERIDFLKKKIKSIPFIDTVDLRYRSFTKQIKPMTTATVFSITDCSGSMGEREKTISRKFFYLLYLFLIKKYEVVNLVWIIHTAEAREVTEKEFFENTESGGTVISTSLELVYNMIQEKYKPEDSNLYILQSTDGDNWDGDNQNVSEWLSKLLPIVQFFGYIQIDREANEDYFFGISKVMNVYKEKMDHFKNLQAKVIRNEKDIWPIFRSLFSKDETHE